MRSLRSGGFSLVELVIVLALFASALAIGSLSMNDWLAKSRQHNLAKAIDHAITRTRTEAIKRNARVTLCVSADQQTCTQDGGWEQGWIIYPDTGNSRTLEVNEPIIHYESGGTFSRLTATGNRWVKSYLSFINNGKPLQLSGALQMGTIAVCVSGQNTINVVIAHTGRTRIERTSTACP